MRDYWLKDKQYIVSTKDLEQAKFVLNHWEFGNWTLGTSFTENSVSWSSNVPLVLPIWRNPSGLRVCFANFSQVASLIKFGFDQIPRRRKNKTLLRFLNLKTQGLWLGNLVMKDEINLYVVQDKDTDCPSINTDYSIYM